MLTGERRGVGEDRVVGAETPDDGQRQTVIMDHRRDKFAGARIGVDDRFEHLEVAKTAAGFGETAPLDREYSRDRVRRMTNDRIADIDAEHGHAATSDGFKDAFGVGTGGHGIRPAENRLVC